MSTSASGARPRGCSTAISTRSPPGWRSPASPAGSPEGFARGLPPKFLQAQPHPALDRADRHLETDGYLGVAHPGVERQHDHLELGFGQDGDYLPHRLAILAD